MEDRELYPAPFSSDGEEAKEETKLTEEKEAAEEEYYELPHGSRSLARSVIALALALLSLGLCFIWYLGVALSGAAAVFSLLHRKRFGYFNKASLSALVISIFGFVFSVFFLAAGLIGLI